MATTMAQRPQAGYAQPGYAQSGYGQSAYSHSHAPAGAGLNVVTKTPDELAPELKQLVQTLKSYARAQTIDEHRVILRRFDEDVTVDTPLIMVQGNDKVRVLSAFYKYFLGRFDIDPKVIRIKVTDEKNAELDIDGAVLWNPNRPWLLPITWLLPHTVHIQSTVSLGVKGHSEKLSFISGNLHNLPHLPRLMRVAAGWLIGNIATLAEPVYFQLQDWYHATTETVASGTEYVRETASSATDTVKDTTYRATEAVRGGVERAAETVGLKGE